jgi:hypothetical protein
MKQNEIRAVEMTREIRDEIYEETKSLSPEEFQAYIAQEARKAPAAPSEHRSDRWAV